MSQLASTDVLGKEGDPAPAADQLLADGEKALACGDYPAAIEYFRRVVQLEPESSKGRTSFGIELARQGALDDALSQFQQAVRLDPAHAGNHFNVGLTLSRLGRQTEAMESLQQATKLDSDHIGAQYTIAQILEASKDIPAALEILECVVLRAPDREDIHLHRAKLLRSVGRSDEAVVLLKQLARTVGYGPKICNAQGLAELDGDKFSIAVKSFERAIDLDPRDIYGHIYLAITLKRLGRVEEAIASYTEAVLLHRNQPICWDPEHGREAAELELLYEGRSKPSTPASDDIGLGDGAGRPRLTLLLGCYGDFPEYSLRAMKSIAEAEDLTRHCAVCIGLNQCCRATTDYARMLVDRGLASTVVESRQNVNKDPMLRLLLEAVRTPYVLWLDDDTHFTNRLWPQAFAEFILAEHPLDVAGEIGRWGPRRYLDDRYLDLVQRRPWWRGNGQQTPELREWISFAIGSLFVARTQFLRQHDFPDRGMVKALDDVLLGELIQQVGGRQLKLPTELLEMGELSNGARRGENYLLRADGKY